MLNRTISKLFVSLFLLNSISGYSQLSKDQVNNRLNPIAPSVSFLEIKPHPSLNGDITAVPDGSLGPGIYGNLGLLALDSSRFRVTIDYTPWLSGLIPKTDLIGLGGCYRLNQRGVIGFSILYFSLGGLTTTDVVGSPMQLIKPKEFATNLSYTYNINEYTGIGIGIKFIYSNLTNRIPVGGITSRTGIAIAGDVGFSKQFPTQNGRGDHFFGASLTNFGTKISYYNDSIIDSYPTLAGRIGKNFIPINLALGYGYRFNLRDRQSLILSYEIKKLLVPTPPLYYSDSVGITGDRVIEYGYNPNVGVFRGMIQSFYDAPGGYREELHEISHAFGIVYQHKCLSFGVGYFLEHKTKGAREFFSAGMSVNFPINNLKKSWIRTTFSFLVPHNQMNPLAKSIRFGLSWCF